MELYFDIVRFHALKKYRFKFCTEMSNLNPLATLLPIRRISLPIQVSNDFASLQPVLFA